MQLREAIKAQGYGANRAIAKRLGYSEQHLHGVANGVRTPSHYMLACLRKHDGTRCGTCHGRGETPSQREIEKHEQEIAA